LVAAFRERQAAVTVVETAHGHQVSMEEVQQAREWLHQ
jgi:phospholipase/carboxylesterase